MRRVACLLLALTLASCADEERYTKMYTGDGLLLAYALPGGGMSGRNAVSAVFTDGKMDSYVWTANAANESPALGTMIESETSSDGRVGVLRWSGGTMGGNFYGLPVTLPIDDGFHFVVGVPAAPEVLDRVRTYAPVGATRPTITGGAALPGSSPPSDGLLKLDYAHSRLGVTATLVANGEPFLLQTGPDTAMAPVDTNENGMLRVLAVPVSSIATCAIPGDCTAFVIAFAAGSGGESAGLAYLISVPGGGEVGGTIRYAQ